MWSYQAFDADSVTVGLTLGSCFVIIDNEFYRICWFDIGIFQLFLRKFIRSYTSKICSSNMVVRYYSHLNHQIRLIQAVGVNSGASITRNMIIWIDYSGGQNVNSKDHNDDANHPLWSESLIKFISIAFLYCIFVPYTPLCKGYSART